MDSIISKQRFDKIVGKFSKLEPIMIYGDLGIDKYTYGNVSRISPEAPVPVLEVTKEWHKLGLAANISHNLKSLEINSTLCGLIGKDQHGVVFRDLMKASDLHTRGLVDVSERPTVFKERITTKMQQICRIDYEVSDTINLEQEELLSQKVEQCFEGHGALIIEDYAKGTVVDSVVQKMISKYRDQDKLITVDPGRRVNPLLYKGATLLKPNYEEAKIMAGILGYNGSDLQEIATVLLKKLGLEMLVITLGGKGMALVDAKGNGKLRIIPTVATKVFDVSGAGDTAISLLTAGLMAGATLEEAAWLGNCGAGVVVAKPGTATVNLDELTQYHSSLLKNINQNLENIKSL